MAHEPPGLLVLTALASEAESLVARASETRGPVPDPGEVRLLDGGGAWVGHAGMGAASVRAALAAFGKDLPRRIVFGGVAGALVPDLAPGDAVLVTEVQDEAGNVAKTSERFTSELGSALERSGVSVRKGRALEVSKLAGEPEAKRGLAGRFSSALVVAMEDHAAVSGALALGAEVACVRVVVDRLSDRVPDLSPALDGAGRPRPLHLATHLARRPTELLALPGLARSFGLARRTLDRVLEAALTLRS